VAELADAPDLGSGSRKAMGVRLPPFAPFDSPAGLPPANRQARSWQALFSESNALSERIESKGLVQLTSVSQ
jgi:hypothetical protein